jgi:hypothetical protein
MMVERTSTKFAGRLFGGLGRRGQANPSANHIALGTFCHAAAGLRDADLRLWSGPFDWIFSTPGLILDCLADDFAALLDPGQLVSVPASELTNGARRQCRHPAFEARYHLPIIFNHHDPASSRADLWRLKRSVARFRTALAGDAPNVFYMLSERTWPEEELSRLAVTLARAPSSNSLAVVTLTATDGPHDVKLVDVAGPGCRRLEVGVTTRSRSRGAAFGNLADDQHLAGALRQIAARLDPTINGHI